jgi:hypothetical protein
MTDLCGKPTKRGAPCQQYRATLEWMGPKADGCFTHMSDADRQILEARRALDRDAEERWLSADPVCWSWPIPADIETWVAPRNPELSGQLNDLLAKQDREDPESWAHSLLAWWQEGRCAVCGHRYHLVEDHDHETGLTRGWLCRGCNIQEGIRRGDGSPFARYRRQHPTSMLGLRIRYWDPFLKGFAPSRQRTAADKWTDAASEDIGL